MVSVLHSWSLPNTNVPNGLRSMNFLKPLVAKAVLGVREQTNSCEGRNLVQLIKNCENFKKVSAIFSDFIDGNEAIKREKVLKKWKREWKIKLIEDFNPSWMDISLNWNLNYNKIR